MKKHFVILNGFCIWLLENQPDHDFEFLNEHVSILWALYHTIEDQSIMRNADINMGNAETILETINTFWKKFYFRNLGGRGIN